MKKRILFLLATLCLLAAAPALAAELDYVTDAAEILSASERQALNARAQSISDTYNLGVYIVTVDDLTEYNARDAYELATAVFNQYDLGYGTEKDGVMLLLSMADRDYALIAHGYGNTVFTDYGKDVLSDEYFLPRFRNNDWAGGFDAYLTGCEYMLSEDAKGTPVDIYDDPPAPREERKPGIGSFIAMVLALPSAIAGLICGGLKSKMRSVRKASSARTYLAPSGCNLQLSNDVFTHVTQTRVRVQQNNRPRSGGGGGGHGTTIHSGGFSGKSGKF